jgi:hypothetical protein
MNRDRGDAVVLAPARTRDYAMHGSAGVSPQTGRPWVGLGFEDRSLEITDNQTPSKEPCTRRRPGDSARWCGAEAHP